MRRREEEFEGEEIARDRTFMPPKGCFKRVCNLPRETTYEGSGVMTWSGSGKTNGVVVRALFQ